ncbi:uncharacterized protein LOC127006190 [Eriocheir sinensis]|uniref:uncharacterized protein LOC127006190 n=1 Tax=Eriocheir sinensis TaxID=95602 RepID=UPI0021C5F21E|nr:uncharacterized protein LOC127006190 [Eriocheir sinensis]
MGAGWWWRWWVVAMVVVVVECLSYIPWSECKVDADCRGKGWPGLCSPGFPCLCVQLRSGGVERKCMLERGLGEYCKWDGQCLPHSEKMICLNRRCVKAEEATRREGGDSSLLTTPLTPSQDQYGPSTSGIVGSGVTVAIVVFFIFIIVSASTRRHTPTRRPLPPPPLRPLPPPPLRPLPPPPLPLPSQSSEPPRERRGVMREPSDPPPPYVALPPPSYEQTMAGEGYRHSFDGGERGSFGVGKGGEEGYGDLPSAPLIASTSMMQLPPLPPTTTSPSAPPLSPSSPPLISKE